MANPLILFPIFFPAICTHLLTLVDAECLAKTCNHGLMRELEALKFKISQLEFMLEESTQNLTARINYLEELERLTNDTSHKVQRLESVLSSTKGLLFSSEDRLNALEEQVRLLWAALRSNNFDLHNLKHKVAHAEEKLKVVTSQVEEMVDIVNEQWMQIQRLEQGLHMAEMRALKVLKEVGSTKCSFFKFMNRLISEFRSSLEMVDLYLLGSGSTLSSIVSRALNQLREVFNGVQRNHHELQKMIKQQMERNEYTASLINSELVFLVASALILFPIMSAWMLVSSQFSLVGAGEEEQS